MVFLPIWQAFYPSSLAFLPILSDARFLVYSPQGFASSILSSGSYAFLLMRQKPLMGIRFVNTLLIAFCKKKQYTHLPGMEGDGRRMLQWQAYYYCLIPRSLL